MCSRILKQALHGLVVQSLGCLHGQEKAVCAAIRIALPERNEVAEEGGIRPSRASGSGYRGSGGAGSKRDRAKWFSHGFSSSSGSLPQRRAVDQ